LFGPSADGVPGPIVTSTWVSFGNASVAANASHRPSCSAAFVLSTRLLITSCAAISSGVKSRVAYVLPAATTFTVFKTAAASIV
jgi:hypothetical protein